MNTAHILLGVCRMTVGYIATVAFMVGASIATLEVWAIGLECAVQTLAHRMVTPAAASTRDRNLESCGARTARDSTQPPFHPVRSRELDLERGRPVVQLASAVLERVEDATAHLDGPEQRADAWLEDIHRVYCGQDEDREFLRALSQDPQLTHVVLADKVERPVSGTFDGSKWVLEYREWAGLLDGSIIYLGTQGTLAERVGFLYHERVHALQPEEMPLAEREYWAYRKTAEWLERRGLPQIPRDFFELNASGQRVIDDQAIRDFVRENYPEHGRPQPFTPSDEGDGRAWFIVGHSGTGKTVICASPAVDLEQGGCKLREPRVGDHYMSQFDHSMRLPGAVILPKARLRCPER